MSTSVRRTEVVTLVQRSACLPALDLCTFHLISPIRSSRLQHESGDKQLELMVNAALESRAVGQELGSVACW